MPTLLSNTFCSSSSAHGVSVASLRSTPVGKMPKNWTGRLMGQLHWLHRGQGAGREGSTRSAGRGKNQAGGGSAGGGSASAGLHAP